MDATNTREIKWSAALRDDVRSQRISYAEWKEIVQVIESVASLDDPRQCDSVCRVAQTAGQWLRIKINRPSSFRVLFSVERDPPVMVIQAVLRRTGQTYNLAELYWRNGR